MFGAINLTKSADFDKWKYFGNGIWFGSLGSFSLSNCSGFGKSVIIFGTNISSSAHIDNNRKDILTLDKGPAQGLYDTTSTAEKEYAISFSEQLKKFSSSLHYNGTNSYLFLNGVEIFKFKAKDSEINAAPLCLSNVLKDFSADNLKETELYGYSYDFSVDYDSIDVDDVLNIHKYLMKKYDIQ